MLPTVDLRLDEGMPLLGSASRGLPSDGNAFEMAPIHTARASLESPTKTQRHKDKQDLTDRIILSVYDRVNVIEALHAFWQKKQSSECDVGCLDLVYMSEPSAGSTYVCYVTLPGGCCFASPQDCASNAEARRSAAHVALVNSVYNELPSRRITESFISNAVREATTSAGVPPLTSHFTVGGENYNSSGVGAYQLVLESSFGQTVLDFAALINKLRIMHWSGALRAMNVRGATRQDVLRAALSDHWTSEDCRSEMALEWMAAERRVPGSIVSELKKANSELHSTRRLGQELAFPRLKRDVLQLAASQTQ